MAKSAIDLFCGAGGLSEGFRQAGFHVLAGNDLDSFAEAARLQRFSDSQFWIP